MRRPRREKRTRCWPNRRAGYSDRAGTRDEIWRDLEPFESRILLSTFTDVTATAFGAANIGGGSAAWGDFNNDGLVDLYVPERLWRNDGGGKFTEVFKGFFPGGKGVWGDYDNNGYLDLYMWASAPVLYRNVGGTSFQSVTNWRPAVPIVASEGATWGDFNGDGLLDLYVGGYEIWPTVFGYPNAFLINNGDHTFRLPPVTAAQPSRGITAADFDEDGDLDVYVANYRLQPNVLARNGGNNSSENPIFANVAGSYNATGGSGHSIGSAIADFDSDGHFDIFAANFAHPDNPHSQFLENRGPNADFHFANRGAAGLPWRESMASPAAGDYNNDGYPDLFVSTAYSSDQDILVRNNGNWTFSNATGGSGISISAYNDQAAWADYDNDGNLDLIAGGRLFRNNGNSNKWLKIKLEGDGQKVNRAAIGAQIRVTAGSRIVSRQIEGGTGQFNQNDLTAHFGLGSYSGPVQVEVFWSDGTKDTFQAETNRMIVRAYDAASEPPTRPGTLSANEIGHDRAIIHWGASTDPNAQVPSELATAHLGASRLLSPPGAYPGRPGINSADTNFNVGPQRLVAGWAGTQYAAASLVKFNLPPLPPGQVVSQVALSLDWLPERNNASQDIRVGGTLLTNLPETWNAALNRGYLQGTGLTNPGGLIDWNPEDHTVFAELWSVTGKRSGKATYTSKGTEGLAQFIAANMESNIVLTVSGATEVPQGYNLYDQWVKNTATLTVTTEPVPITYELKYRKEDLSDAWSSIHTTPQTSYTITGLEPQTAYRVFVRANDGQDTSGWRRGGDLFTTANLLPGDANGDGVVSADDYVSVQMHFGNTAESSLFGDADGDGLVSADDYVSVQGNFGDSSSSPIQLDPEVRDLALKSAQVAGDVVLRAQARDKLFYELAPPCLDRVVFGALDGLEHGGHVPYVGRRLVQTFPLDPVNDAIYCRVGEDLIAVRTRAFKVIPDVLAECVLVGTIAAPA